MLAAYDASVLADSTLNIKVYELLSPPIAHDRIRKFDDPIAGDRALLVTEGEAIRDSVERKYWQAVPLLPATKIGNSMEVYHLGDVGRAGALLKSSG